MARVEPIEGDLARAHLKVLRERAIKPKAVRARGYRSARSVYEARRAGFGETQARPGLVIPIWTVEGDHRFNQLRPDEPRIADGKPLKYETPAGKQLVVDVPPAVRASLDDPKVPLWLTEGPLKADALLSAGLAMVSVAAALGWLSRRRPRAGIGDGAV